MKKLLIGLLSLILLLPNISFSAVKLATLINPNGVKIVVVAGSQTAQQYFGDGFVLYTGEPMLGFSVVSNYKTTLSRSISSTASTIYVSSLSTKDGHTLTMADLGSKVFLTLEPGSNKEEIVMCTSIGTLLWNSCTRGLAFYATSTAAVTANQKSHSAGSAIVMSNVHYVYDQLVDKDTANTIDGLKTYSTYPRIQTYAAPTVDEQLAPKKYVDDTITSGAPDATTGTKGLTQIATGANASAGATYGSSGAMLVLPSSMATSSNDVAGIHVPITKTSGKLDTSFIDQTANYTWSGTNSFATSTMATTTFSGKVLGAGFGGDGSDGALSVSAGATTTLSIASASTLIKNYTSITIPATAGLAFSLPNTNGSIITLKSQGDCTIGGFIDLRQLGAASSSSATIGNVAYGVITTAQAGTVGNTYDGTTGGGAASSNSSANYFLLNIAGKFIKVTPGGSGGGGGFGGRNGSSDSNVAGGRSGAGGGVLILECAGSLNFTGSINASGQTGAVGTDSANWGAGGGGGGGAGGTVAVIYNLLTANTGTININGGNGGAGGDGNSGNAGGAGGGGGGGANLYYGGGGGAGAPWNSSAGTAGTTGGGTGGGTGGAVGGADAGNDGGGGGGGSAGGSYVVKNTEF